MEAIKITRACAVKGQALKTGRVLTIPDDISANDAKLLCDMKRAAPANKPKPKKVDGG